MSGPNLDVLDAHVPLVIRDDAWQHEQEAAKAYVLRRTPTLGFGASETSDVLAALGLS